LRDRLTCQTTRVGVAPPPPPPPGSGTLVRAMLADGLVDELHLFVYPLTRGSGPRLFPEEAAPGKLSLTACESYENGVVYLAYRPQA
jgi:dihydrofolate reductase